MYTLWQTIERYGQKSTLWTRYKELIGAIVNMANEEPPRKKYVNMTLVVHELVIIV